MHIIEVFLEPIKNNAKFKESLIIIIFFFSLGVLKLKTNKQKNDI